jgi:hypothetical protein
MQMMLMEIKIFAISNVVHAEKPLSLKSRSDDIHSFATALALLGTSKAKARVVRCCAEPIRRLLYWLEVEALVRKHEELARRAGNACGRVFRVSSDRPKRACLHHRRIILSFKRIGHFARNHNSTIGMRVDMPGSLKVGRKPAKSTLGSLLEVAKGHRELNRIGSQEKLSRTSLGNSALDGLTGHYTSGNRTQRDRKAEKVSFHFYKTFSLWSLNLVNWTGEHRLAWQLLKRNDRPSTVLRAESERTGVIKLTWWSA